MTEPDDVKNILRRNVDRLHVSASALEEMLETMEYEKKTVTDDYLSFLRNRSSASDEPVKSDVEKRLNGLLPFVGQEYVPVLLRSKTGGIALSVGIHLATNAVLYSISTN